MMTMMQLLMVMMDCIVVMFIDERVAKFPPRNIARGPHQHKTPPRP